MAKRRLTDQQRRRIRNNQQRPKEYSDNKAGSDGYTDEDLLGPELEGVVISLFGSEADIEGQTGEVYRCFLRANIESIVTGDKVTWQPGNPKGVVTAVQSRQSSLCRPDSRGELRPVAANIDRIVVVIAPKPEPHANLIDRYLVAAEIQGIKPILVLNKVDLAGGKTEGVMALVKRYSLLGYPVVSVSAKCGTGLEKLAGLLKSHTSVVVGQSGVGKSSLLNALSPEINTAVGALSSAAEKGTHTTTASRLFHLPGGGDVIDSPGIREFGLWHLGEKEVAKGFIEFQPYLGHCKFRDCQHRDEPGCALNKAVESGNISQVRFDSYWAIRKSLEAAKR